MRFVEIKFYSELMLFVLVVSRCNPHLDILMWFYKFALWLIFR